MDHESMSIQELEKYLDELYDMYSYAEDKWDEYTTRQEDSEEDFSCEIEDAEATMSDIECETTDVRNILDRKYKTLDK